MLLIVSAADSLVAVVEVEDDMNANASKNSNTDLTKENKIVFVALQASSHHRQSHNNPVEIISTLT